jgi:hypothetical protein
VVILKYPAPQLLISNIKISASVAGFHQLGDPNLSVKTKNGLFER